MGKAKCAVVVVVVVFLFIDFLNSFLVGSFVECCRWYLHDDAFALLRPRVVLLVGCVDQRIVLLVLLHVLSHRGDALRQWPPLHRGLVLHVLDLLLQCVTVHGC